ncbi:hypothetical protein J421_5489 (plasmid) [Gemmatirosa kalamazoonensis]|uniref:Uncharacterized protein n=1 Tax=Gemmatirosa kalamazoonensis TaxID=861299 RepID=W0RPU3_9BACT|nr:hypothetical protein [Gemmatirosa kalamazoonensis]AHG93024.1 hypothetical protein J421_5489 [Gemmatirosa kalamazoonensis]
MMLPTALLERLDRLVVRRTLHAIDRGTRPVERTIESIDFLATAGAEALVMHLPHAELMRAAEADLHSSLAWLAERAIIPCPLT